ncbi:MAG: membrane protein insertase YidC [Spirochaetales bacterium]|nr:MAG: membrane protein insertase YidC [Spirochaetales bacterium]
MDRRTLLAVVLSVVVITIGFSIQSILFPPAEAPATVSDSDGYQVTQPVEQTTESQTDTSQTIPTATAIPARIGAVLPVPEDGIGNQERTYKDNLISVTFSPYGGSVVSYQLLDHLDGDSPVDMLFRGAEDQRAFTLHFGEYSAPAIDALFHFQQINGSTYEFYRDFYVVGQEGQPFRITKRFTFVPVEYLFQLDVILANSANAQIPLNFNGAAYTVGFVPQIGPMFEKLDQRTEFRRYLTFDEGKKSTPRVGNNDVQVIEDRISWAAIAGKYFAVIALTDNRDLTTVFGQQDREGLPVGSQLSITRPVIQASSVEDSYQFYVGPKASAALNRSDDPDENAWGRQDLELRNVQETRALFGWLDNILKWMLKYIVMVVPNYGIAIIILTMIVKLALWPLTRKSYESNARMQAVQPKMQEIKEKYKDDTAKQNEAMAKLYKEEKVNPLGGCLPMLAQFPFFLAMYGLFSNHFDLRGAVFIPGWISDLSVPDIVVAFGSFTIPLLGWTALRGLPFIFVATQLLSSKLMQTATPGQSSGQMKMMQYGMPLMFFFILYNVPSGLLVYWIFSNLLTSAQQYYYNKMKKKTPPPPPPTTRKKRS